MKKAIRALYQSFYSKSLYRDAAHVWTGTGIGVLAWVVLFLGLLTALTLVVKPSDYSSEKAHLLEQFPALKIENGIFSIDRPTPYYITSKDGAPIALIDTSEASAQLTIDDMMKVMSEKNVPLFISQKSALIAKNNGEYRIYNFDDFNKDGDIIQFDKTDVTGWIEKAEIFGIPCMLLLLYGMVLLYAIIQMLIYSVAGLIFNKILGANLGYSALQRITVCAVLPESMLGTAASVFGGDIPFIVCLIMTLGYLFFGIKSAKA